MGQFRYCRCEDSPYLSGPNWYIDGTNGKAWCAACGLDIRPEAVRKAWAIALNERSRVGYKFPGALA
jgi:hypothetical protein